MQSKGKGSLEEGDDGKVERQMPAPVLSVDIGSSKKKWKVMARSGILNFN